MYTETFKHVSPKKAVYSTWSWFYPIMGATMLKFMRLSIKVKTTGTIGTINSLNS